MSFKAKLEQSQTKLSKLDRLQAWIDKLDQGEREAAIMLLRDESAAYAAEALTEEGFPAGQQLVYAWRQRHGVQ